MTITTFDRYSSEAFVKELKALAKDLAAKHGVSLVDEGNWRYGSDTLKLPLEFRTMTIGGAPKISSDLHYHAGVHGIDYMMISRDGYQITDYRRSRPKFPWSIRNVHTGVQQKATTGWVKDRFKKGMVSTPYPAPSTPISHPAHPTAQAAMVTDLVKKALADDDEITTPNNRYEGQF